MRQLMMSFVVVIGVGTPVLASADDFHEFIMSCSYGVLAGTLVGAASLAFESQPGKNLNNVARGASLGLYAGILLGFYVISLPDENEKYLSRFSLSPTVSPKNDFDGIEGRFRWISF
jgi:hypothetical protein